MQSVCLPTLQRVRSKHSQLNGTIVCMQGEGGRGGRGEGGEGGRGGGVWEAGGKRERVGEGGRNRREKGGRGEGKKKSSSGEKEERGRGGGLSAWGFPLGFPLPHS